MGLIRFRNRDSVDRVISMGPEENINISLWIVVLALE